jgi:RNAse (barnase) inhibitor barstar
MPNFVISKNIPEYNTDDILVANIDGEKCKTLKKFYSIIEKELLFPDYFSRNLDSFDEMINDLTWLEQEAVIIIIKNFDSFLEKEELEEEDNKGLIMSLIDQAADEQSHIKDGVPIKIIIEFQTELEAYLETNGIEFIKN